MGVEVPEGHVADEEEGAAAEVVAEEAAAEAAAAEVEEAVVDVIRDSIFFYPPILYTRSTLTYFYAIS